MDHGVSTQAEHPKIGEAVESRAPGTYNVPL
jgi:hypothetical protein